MLLKFKEFRANLKEGGNIQIGDEAAQKIDLEEIPRSEITPLLMDGLKALNKEFEKFAGVKLWNEKVFSDLSFFSGSSVHFFDTAISDYEFKSNKPKVGDIDTQVDENFKNQIENFLESFSGDAGPLKYIGHKPSAGQFITLWNVKEFDVNVQIDLELSDFYEGEPTEWSQFSHSSSWDDMKEGIKGVFHKYALRSLTRKDATEEVIVRTPGGQKENTVKTNKFAFSVGRGLRQKIEPVMDDNGKQLRKDGKLVFREMKTSESNYTTDLDVMFRTFFDRPMQGNRDKKAFNSFIGVLELIDREWDQQQKQLFIEGIFELLWASDAQKLERDAPDKDYDIKMTVWNKMMEILNGVKKPQNFKEKLQQYYENY